jgi:hypothetical protein
VGQNTLTFESIVLDYQKHKRKISVGEIGK